MIKKGSGTIQEAATGDEKEPCLNCGHLFLKKDIENNLCEACRNEGKIEDSSVKFCEKKS